jgi:hypothetical protein
LPFGRFKLIFALRLAQRERSLELIEFCFGFAFPGYRGEQAMAEAPLGARGLFAKAANYNRRSAEAQRRQGDAPRLKGKRALL